MSWRRFSRRLEDVLKTSWRHLDKTSWKRVEDVLKTYGQDEYIGLEDVLKTSSEDVRLRRTYLSWSRRLEDVFKTFSEDEDEGRSQDVFKTSLSRRMFAGKDLDNGIWKTPYNWSFYGCQCQACTKTFNLLFYASLSLKQAFCVWTSQSQMSLICSYLQYLLPSFGLITLEKMSLLLKSIP